jgi:NAD(P)-dependent dehydrogenase (short-subunit alcohol dehydrogenase family)
MLLQDKVVIISGIGPGLGTMLAVHAAAEGARGVVVSARRAEGLDEAERAVAETGARCAVLKQVNDIRDASSCDRLVSATVERFGRIDALVNNAFVQGEFSTVMTADLDAWHVQYGTNLIGTLKMSRAVIEQMKTQEDGGAIVMVNTKAARAVASFPVIGYAASKAALAYATKALALEVGPYGIRVNSLHPGWIWGDVSRAHVHDHPEQWGNEEEAHAQINGRAALPRAATEDEVADATLFLVSDYARAITGASLDANAGEYMP